MLSTSPLCLRVQRINPNSTSGGPFVRLKQSTLHSTGPFSAQHPREDVCDKSCVSGVSDDFPVQLATRLPDWSAGGLLRCSAAVCPCVVLQSPRARHARLVADILATMSRGCCATKLRGKLLPWNLSFAAQNGVRKWNKIYG